MTESLLSNDCLEQLLKYKKLYIGFSGGLDSTVLLHILASETRLKDKLYAVHIHHGLSPNADFWEAHCQQFCALFVIPLIHRRVKCTRDGNIEEKARVARYQVFFSLLEENDGLLLGHHCDDQAETLLLQLLRGAGIDGLASMVPEKTLSRGTLLRPLLAHSRQTLLEYAQKHDLTWIEDESNQDEAFSRNYLRHQVMPLLREKWPAVVKNLVQSAHHCYQAKKNLEELAYQDCIELKQKKNTLSVSPLQALDHARLSNVLRVWLKNNKVRLPSTQTFNRLITEVIGANQDAQPIVAWGDVQITRYRHRLYLLSKNMFSRLTPSIDWSNFPEPLYLDEEQRLQASLCDAGLQVPADRCIQVRFRQGGEVFYWRRQTKQLKKLFQQWQIPVWQRDKIPLIFIDDNLAAVVGYAVSDHYYTNHLAYCIELQYVTRLKVAE